MNKKARIAILEYRKADAPGVHPWDRHGVSERYYYKLVKRLASKDDSRYRVDDQVHDAIRAHLQDREGHTERRAAAMGLLLERGFSREAARKWLQRHPIEQALSARPRPPAQRV
ncbi:MAG: hypothetical protein EPO26_16475 [Chloroflexota bacterium]|nr:MAG: hypothetical protein EPO26_16475 [Chloroflexota bacterium]